MKRARHAILVLCLASLSGCRPNTPTVNLAPRPTAAQESPVIASITDLSLHPLKFDGRLVLVRARLALGWEGDNFLIDPSAPANGDLTSFPSPSLWLYCKPGNANQLYNALRQGDRRALGTFVGYFHFVPDQKSRMKNVFDPGPLQLEAIGVFDVGPAAAMGVPWVR